MERTKYAESATGVALSYGSISIAGTTYGNWIDTLGFDSSIFGVQFNITSGTVSGVVISYSDLGPNSSYSDAANDDDHFALYAPSAFPISTSGIFQVSGINKHRWIRIGFTTSNPTVSMTAYGIYFLQDAIGQPNSIAASVLSANQINTPQATGDSLIAGLPKRKISGTMTCTYNNSTGVITGTFSAGYVGSLPLSATGIGAITIAGTSAAGYKGTFTTLSITNTTFTCQAASSLSLSADGGTYTFIY